jgi:hypothetical protein
MEVWQGKIKPMTGTGKFPESANQKPVESLKPKYNQCDNWILITHQIKTTNIQESTNAIKEKVSAPTSAVNDSQIVAGQYGKLQRTQYLKIHFCYNTAINGLKHSTFNNVTVLDAQENNWCYQCRNSSRCAIIPVYFKAGNCGLFELIP